MSNGIDQYVYLVPQRDAQGTVSWTWYYNAQFGTTPVPAIDANNGKNNLTFTIADPQNTIKFAGYQTPDDTSKALWISPKGSPTAKQEGQYYDKKKDFDSFAIQQGGTKLVMSDVNGKKLDFVYQLNFVDSANNNKAVTSIDPEIKNGDGSPYYAAAAIYYVGAGLIGAMLALVFVRFALGWRKLA